MRSTRKRNRGDSRPDQGRNRGRRGPNRKGTQTGARKSKGPSPRLSDRPRREQDRCDNCEKPKSQFRCSEGYLALLDRRRRRRSPLHRARARVPLPVPLTLPAPFLPSHSNALAEEEDRPKAGPRGATFRGRTRIPGLTAERLDGRLSRKKRRHSDRGRASRASEEGRRPCSSAPRPPANGAPRGRRPNA